MLQRTNTVAERVAETGAPGVRAGAPRYAARRRLALAAATLVAAAVLLGRVPVEVASPARSAAASVTAATPDPASSRRFLEYGDLPSLARRGTLRVLALGAQDGRCEPQGAVLHERALIEGLAHDLGLEPLWVCVPEARDLTRWLLSGRGDLIAGHLDLASLRADRVAPALPVAAVRYALVARADHAVAAAPGSLADVRIAVSVHDAASPAVSAWIRRQRLSGVHAVDLPREALLAAVAAGRYDAAVVARDVSAEALAGWSRLAIVRDVGATRAVAWGVRPWAHALREAVDHFLATESAAHRTARLYREDLPGIEARGVLRVLAREGTPGYFVAGGRVRGFEYELVRRFAEERGLDVEVIVPPSEASLYEWLGEGLGDVVAMPIAAPPGEAPAGVAFTRPYRELEPVVAARPGAGPIESVAALAGREVAVPAGDAAFRNARRALRTAGAVPVPAPRSREVGPMAALVGVHAGYAELALADARLVDAARAAGLAVAPALRLGDGVGQRWAVRSEDRALAAALDAFIRREYRGEFYNVVLRRHVEQRADAGLAGGDDVAGRGELSPYDGLVKHRALHYRFDWRLIVAQMYQESRFDPDARSHRGARGLMQVMPPTAAEMGIEDLSEPDDAIHAGVKYLAWLRGRFERELPVSERTWFALAAYNAGYRRVAAARALAARLDLDPDRWFGHVEQAMLALPREERAHRRCRCAQPVHYVRDIRTRYAAYARLGDERSLAAARPRSPALRPVDRAG